VTSCRVDKSELSPKQTPVASVKFFFLAHFSVKPSQASNCWLLLLSDLLINTRSENGKVNIDLILEGLQLRQKHFVSWKEGREESSYREITRSTDCEVWNSTLRKIVSCVRFSDSSVSVSSSLPSSLFLFLLASSSHAGLNRLLLLHLPCPQMLIGLPWDAIKAETQEKLLIWPLASLQLCSLPNKSLVSKGEASQIVRRNLHGWLCLPVHYIFTPEDFSGLLLPPQCRCLLRDALMSSINIAFARCTMQWQFSSSPVAAHA
jgi:hypothetical protein